MANQPHDLTAVKGPTAPSVINETDPTRVVADKVLAGDPVPTPEVVLQELPAKAVRYKLRRRFWDGSLSHPAGSILAFERGKAPKTATEVAD